MDVRERRRNDLIDRYISEGSSIDITDRDSDIVGALLEAGLSPLDIEQLAGSGDGSTSEITGDELAALRIALSGATPTEPVETPVIMPSLPLSMLMSMAGCGQHKEGEAALSKLQRGEALTEDEALQALAYYESHWSEGREALVDDLYTAGEAQPAIRRLLEALPSNALYETESHVVKDLLKRVQNDALTALSGQTMDEIAATQGRWLQSEAEGDAIAAANTKAKAEAKAAGDPPPDPVTNVTPDEVNTAFKEQVEAMSGARPYTDRWQPMTDKSKWMEEARKKRAAVVAEVNARVPGLEMSESDIKIDPAAIEKRAVKDGGGVFALSGRPLTVGIDFFEAVDANPEYVIGTVVHEVYGHPGYGASTETLSWQVFNAAADHFDGYSKPWWWNRHREQQVYGYPETELYSELIEAEHFVPMSAADQASGILTGDSPIADVPAKLRAIDRAFEPTVARVLVESFWERIRLDPRVGPKGIELFRSATESIPNFQGVTD